METTSDDIRNIRPGEYRAYRCKDYKECRCLRSMVTYVKNMGCPAGIAGYSTKYDRKQMILIVRAIPVTEIVQAGI